MEKKDVIDFKNDIEKIFDEIAIKIVGQKDIIKYVLIAMLSEGNVLLEGVPGLGKTELIKTISEVFTMNFKRIQFTPDLMPSDVTGTNMVEKDSEGNTKFKFQKGPVFTNLLLADEINRATPKTQSAMLEAMQEKTITFGGTTYNLDDPFFVLATQNPLEMEGTYPLPEAQIDRFMFKLNISYPNIDELIKIVDITTGEQNMNIISKISSAKELVNLREICKKVPISSDVKRYVSKLVIATHPETGYEISKKYIRFGASPRGAQSIIKGAKVNALINGRYNVSYDDIYEMAKISLRHRLILNYEAMSENITTDDIIEILLNEVSD
jgi:MoxR-like ATPase